MLASGLMLAYQEWGPEVVQYKYSDEDPTGRKWVEHQFDLIVLPSHGRSGVQRLLIGSTAERVVRLAHCPVLVLRC